MNEFKVLIHIPETDRLESGFTQAKNFILGKKDGKKIVRLLLNSDAVNILNNFSLIEEHFKEALKLGVEVYFCENALRFFKISFDKIPEGGKTVPAGIIAMVEWQNQGFVYIRA